MHIMYRNVVGTGGEGNEKKNQKILKRFWSVEKNIIKLLLYVYKDLFTYEVYIC